MKANAFLLAFGFAVLFVLCASAPEFTGEAYRNPPPESSVAMFCMWNAELKTDILCAQSDEMNTNGLGNGCINPFFCGVPFGRMPVMMLRIV